MYETKSSMDNLPEEILLKTFSYLDILDLGECAVVSKRFQKICQDESLEYSKNNLIPSLYKRTTSYYLKELVKLGEYETAKEFYRKGWTNQWHLDDNVTFECRNYSIRRLFLAMKPSPEKDDYLVEYAKNVEKTIYNIATTKHSYFYLMAESTYNHYHLSNPSYDFDLTNETPYFGCDCKINQNLKDTVRVLINVSECECEDIRECDCDFTNCGHVSYKLRDHMVQLTIQAVGGPLLSNYQEFLSHPRSTNLIDWAMSIEFETHRKTNSRAEYLRVMVVNIYKVLAELTDKRAHRKARNGAQRVQGVHGVQDVNHVAQVVHSVHSTVHSIHKLEKVLAEITDKRAHRVVQARNGAQGVHSVHNQIPVGQKFVRPSNFKSGCRRKFFLFSDAHQIKEDEGIAQKPKNVSLKHFARDGLWINTNMETYQKHGNSELSSGRIRRKQEPKRLRPVASGVGGL